MAHIRQSRQKKKRAPVSPSRAASNTSAGLPEWSKGSWSHNLTRLTRWLKRNPNSVWPESRDKAEVASPAGSLLLGEPPAAPHPTPAQVSPILRGRLQGVRYFVCCLGFEVYGLGFSWRLTYFNDGLGRAGVEGVQGVRREFA